MKPGYCPICGVRVAIIPAGEGPCGPFPERTVSTRTMQEHQCRPDDVKAMSRLRDFASREEGTPRCAHCRHTREQHGGINDECSECSCVRFLTPEEAQA